MSILLHGDCLEQMKTLDDKSVDFIFCDLPYGQTSCKWDIIIAWEPFWKEIMRVKKLHTPIFMTTTTKFGVELINNCPKKCPFRYDLVWVKSAPAGFLSAKKMPMRKHEMVYVFYEKLPFYDLSSHQHKFIKKTESKRSGNSCYGKLPNETQTKYEPPLPVSVVREPEPEPESNMVVVKNNNIYHNKEVIDYKERKGGPMWDPPLPVSVVKEPEPEPEIMNSELYGELPTTDSYAESIGMNKADKHKVHYDPPLPVSVLKEPEPEPEEDDKYSNGTINSKTYDIPNKSKGGMYRSPAGQYDPPLPVSVVKEDGCYGEKVPNSEAKYGQKCARQYDPPLPTTIVKEDVYKANERFNNGKLTKHARNLQKGDEPIYDPPLPNTLLEIKSTRGKHSTEKPVALMEWLLKYFSKEGDTVLDPTMGSGSTGVACKNMGRNFIGIEMDADIFEVAVNRVEN